HLSQLRAAVCSDVRRTAAKCAEDSRFDSVYSAPQPIATDAGERDARNAGGAGPIAADPDGRNADQLGGRVCKLPGRQRGKWPLAGGARNRRTGRRCDVKAIFFKELRENSKWAVGIFLIFGVIIY